MIVVSWIITPCGISISIPEEGTASVFRVTEFDSGECSSDWIEETVLIVYENFRDFIHQRCGKGNSR
jgi:hypothetical protein